MREQAPEPVKHCLACGAVLTRKSYRYALETPEQFRVRAYCDRNCRGKAKTLENPTPGGVRNRNRPVVRKYRGRTCENCGATEDLCLHHDDENPQNNDPGNLVTLCRSCHSREHMRRRLSRRAKSPA